MLYLGCAKTNHEDLAYDSLGMLAKRIQGNLIAWSEPLHLDLTDLDEQSWTIF